MSHPESTLQRVEQCLLKEEAFSRLASLDVRELIHAGNLKRVEPGQVLVEHGALNSPLILVIQGELRSLIPGGTDQRRTLRKIYNGQVAGLASYLNNKPIEEITASTRTVILEIQGDKFLSWLESKHLENFFLLRPIPEEVGAILSQRGFEIEKVLELSKSEFTEGNLRIGEHPSNLVQDTELEWFSLFDDSLPTPAHVPRPMRLIGLPKSWFDRAEGSVADLDSVNLVQSPTHEGNVGLHEADVIEIKQKFDEDVVIQSEPGISAAVACMQMIATEAGMKFRGELIHRFLSEQCEKGQTPSLLQIGSCCEMQGWPARLLKVSAENLLAVETPALVIYQGQPTWLHNNRGGEVHLVSPVAGSILLDHEELNTHFPNHLEVLCIQIPKDEGGKKFNLSWFVPVLKQHKKVLIEVFLASLLVQIFALANPLVTQLIIDKVLVQNSPGTLHVLGILLAILVVAGTITSALRTYLFVDTTNRIDLTLGGRVADRLYRLTLGYFGRRPVGEISNRLAELENIRQFLTGTVLTVTLDGIFALIYIGLMLFYNVTLTLVALAALPLFAFITLLIAPIYQAQIRQRARDRAASQAYLVETLTGIQTVKSQNLEHRARRDWQERYASYIASSFKTTITSTAFSSITGMLGKFSDLAVLWVGTLLVIDNHLTLGQLIAFRIISGYVSNPLLRLIQSWQSFQEAALSVERLGDVMNAEPEQMPEQAASIPLPQVKGEVTFEKVRFSYNTSLAPTLFDLSFTIKPGMFVGIVGLSGSGKSTMVKLLPRLCVPDSGRVLIDGYDISKVELSSIRQQVATVLQDTLLFDVSIEENISLGKPDIKAEEVVRVAKITKAHDFVMKMPLGYATPAGEQGRNMSGGQRQRIALARAVLQNPRILILDEATSALDVPTEREVCKNLRNEFQGRTIFFVTHRLHNLDQADHILVLDEGVLIESGKHDELMARKGVYSTLYRQTQGA